LKKLTFLALDINLQGIKIVVNVRHYFISPNKKWKIEKKLILRANF